jgi:heme exporter protein D
MTHAAINGSPFKQYFWSKSGLKKTQPKTLLQCNVLLCRQSCIWRLRPRLHPHPRPHPRPSSEACSRTTCSDEPREPNPFQRTFITQPGTEVRKFTPLFILFAKISEKMAVHCKFVAYLAFAVTYMPLNDNILDAIKNRKYCLRHVEPADLKAKGTRTCFMW